MPFPPARILVVGATGMLGKPVADQLRATGFSIRVLARSHEKGRRLFPEEDIEIVAGDVTDSASLARALDGCAGVHISLKGGPDAAGYERIEHQGTRAVAEAARAAGVQQLTYLSAYTVGPQTASSPESRAKWQAEQAIRASGVPFTIFRATWFLESLPLFVQGRVAVLIGRQPHPLHWLAAADYGQMVARSYQTPAALGRELYLYGPEALTMRAALKRYGAHTTPGLAVLTLPVWLGALIGRASGSAELRSLTTLMAYYDRHGETGDAAEARRICGAPTTSLEQWCRERRPETPAATADA